MTLGRDTAAHLHDAERPRLLALAYRILGSRSDAEDVVQDAYLALRAAIGVDRPAGWLTTFVVRRSIDTLRRRQREGYVGPWLPEPVVEEADRPDAAAEHTELLEFGVLRLYEVLTPPQRAVLVLRSFDYPHAEIAKLLEISDASSRQHERRARSRLETEPEFANRRTKPAEARRLLAAFLRAARDGDLEGLVQLLRDDVVVVTDGGGRVRAALNPVVGARRVARFAVGLARRHTERSVRLTRVNGAPGAVVTLSGARHVVAVEVREGLIARLDVIVNPVKLRSVR